jgi:hypothetical protein
MSSNVLVAPAGALIPGALTNVHPALCGKTRYALQHALDVVPDGKLHAILKSTRRLVNSLQDASSLKPLLAFGRSAQTYDNRRRNRALPGKTHV